MIEAVDLSKRYPKGTLALDALNLEVRRGEVYYLLGAKGAGKTTAIDLFLGLTEPTAGRARIDGLEVARESRRARERIGFVGAGVALYDRLTVFQNLELLARLGRCGDRSRAALEMALREVGLPEAAFHRKLAGSGAAVVRKILIAATWLRDVPALLLDDPLAGLDPKESSEIVELLEALRDQGRALLLTTQNPFWAHRLGDRFGILQEGRQVLTRSREELRGESLERIYLDYMRGALRTRPGG